MKFNRRIEQVVGSTTLAITAKAKELKAQGFDVVNFAAGEPDFDTPDSIKKAAIKAINDGLTKYTPSSGIIELRKSIAAKFKRDNNLEYAPNQIVVSCGAKHSIYNVILCLVDDGDEVIVPSPYWVSYPEMIKIAGGVPKYIKTTASTGFKLSAQQLSDAVTSKTKLLILNSPSNPTGMVYSKAELQAIADVCVKNNIYVISDEIYEELIYDTTEYTSIASLGKEIYNLTITVNGVSKAYAMTGWRIGYAAGSKEIMEVVQKLQDHSTSNPTTISQYATLQALNEPKEITKGMRDEFRKRRDLIYNLFLDCPKVKCIKPEGAFYLFVDFSAVGDSEKIAKAILEEKYVAAIPGDSFGAPGFIRMSFSTSQERITEGVKRIKEWISKK
ncbi:MAG: pyridoxal phosphate-dependent aminotransferase [Candidatus Omnitrophica bacterium]|nr:pyridoxal phosphate-dependent aminotransferase [Candidatus Omnitrophota bacterium]